MRHVVSVVACTRVGAAPTTALPSSSVSAGARTGEPSASSAAPGTASSLRPSFEYTRTYSSSSYSVLARSRAIVSMPLATIVSSAASARRVALAVALALPPPLPLPPPPGGVTLVETATVEAVHSEGSRVAFEPPAGR